MLSVKIIDVKTATIDQQKTKLVKSDELLDIVEPLAQELIDVAISESAPNLVEPQTQELIDVVTDVQSAPNLSSKDVEPVNDTTDIPTPPHGTQRNGDSYNPDDIELVYMAGMDAEDTDGFYIGKYEITQAQWKAIMGNNPSKKQALSHPVTNVNWNEVQQFLVKLGEKTGRTYRLPTETEWEYAANGGSNGDTYEYAGSDQIDDVAWYDGNSGRTTHEVGVKKPNSAGIYDMSGNVWEWCEDWYDSSHSTHTLRGGGWGGNASYCRVSDRMSSSPGTSYSYLGFRVVLIVSLLKAE
jgi:hypothetical protein